MKKKLYITFFFLSMMLLLTACGTTEIDMNDYVDFSFSGYEYVGNATPEVDVRKMLLDNEECFGFDRKALKSGDGEDVLEDLEDAFKVKLDKKDGYQNDDRVSYSWDVDDDILEDIAEEYKVLFLYNDSDVKVSGLDESRDINLFEDLYIDFYGRNGAGYVNYLDCYDYYYLDYYIDDDMVVSKTDGLSNGDVVTVTLSDDLIKEYRTYGYNPNPASKDIIVDGLTVPEVVDAFRGIEVEFSGNSPYITAYVDIGNADYYYEFDFSYDTSGYFANGDIFEITLTESGMEYALEYYNLIPESTTKIYTINRATPTPPSETPNIGNTTSANTSIDRVAILDVQDAVVALSGQNYGNFMLSEEIFDKESAGWVIGSEEFDMDFVAASHFAPMISSSAFELAFFRVAEGVDTQAFADALRAKANPVKWMCVQAEVVQTAIRDNTILFVMSDEYKAKALIEGFHSYDPATYVPPVKANPLNGKTMEDMFWDITSGCGFIEAATDGTYNETSKEKLGFVNFDASACEDIYVDYSTEGSAYPYAIGLFRLPEGTDCYSFMAGLEAGVDVSLYGDTADFTLYYDEAENVVAYCAATSYDIVMAFQDAVVFSYPDMFYYR